MPQLAFKWPHSISYATEDFVVSDSNAEAVRFLDAWPDGSSKTALLSGASASGKTHLVHRWLERVGGVVLEKSTLGKVASEALWPQNTPAVLEDIETVNDEAALFHLLRHAETGGAFLLLTANVAPKQLAFVLPDLRSRLLALPAVRIEPPDDALLRMFIVKLFADRQLRLNEEILEYIARRIERSFASVCGLVDEIERISLETRREITIPLVRTIFDS